MRMHYVKRPINTIIYGFTNYGLLAYTTIRMLMEFLNKLMITESWKTLKNIKLTLSWAHWPTCTSFSKMLKPTVFILNSWVNFHFTCLRTVIYFRIKQGFWEGPCMIVQTFIQTDMMMNNFYGHSTIKWKRSHMLFLGTILQPMALLIC